MLLLSLCCAVFLQTEDMFFDPDDMDKFADEGTMDDDLEGESRASATHDPRPHKPQSEVDRGEQRLDLDIRT